MEVMEKTKFQRRLRVVFAFCMALATVMCYFLLPLSGIAFTDKDAQEQVPQLIEGEKDKLRKEGTALGDIYDRNDTLIVSGQPGGKVEYARDSEKYTMTVGFDETDIGSGYLMERMSEDLRYSDYDNGKGRSLKLTLDCGLQEMLWDGIQQGAGTRASVAVLDAVTGGVMGLAFSPSFSLDELREVKQEWPEKETFKWQDVMLKELVPDGGNQEKLLFPLRWPTRPGSIYKIITGIGIVENGLQNVVIDDGGALVDDYGPFHVENNDQNTYGPLEFHNAFLNSSNVYFARMSHDYLGWDKMTELANRCMIGVPLECDFAQLLSTFESALDPFDTSVYPNEKLARIGYGYADLQINVVQAAMIAQGIANGGTMCKPYMVETVYTTKGYQTDPETWEYFRGEETESRSGYTKGETYRIASPETAAVIGSTMADAAPGDIQVNGKTYSVALKTGTADLDMEDSTLNNIWMVSYAPADDPRYVVAINRYEVQNSLGIDLFSEVEDIYEYLFQNEERTGGGT